MLYTNQEKAPQAMAPVRAQSKKFTKLTIARIFVLLSILSVVILIITLLAIKLPVKYEFIYSNQNECGVSMHNPYYCYSEDLIKPQTAMWSKSAYETVRGQINPNVSTCKPSKFWYLSRNGAMLPNPTDLADILANNERLQREILLNYDKGRTSLCASDMELIKNWKFDESITPDRARHFTPFGWEEAKTPAQRYQSAFPSLLPPTYSPSHYFFRSANQNRTVGHIRAFADGLFGDDGYKQVGFEDIPETDLLLDAINYCPLWREAVTNLVREQEEFLEGPEYQKMSGEVSAKLGFHGTHALTLNDIALLDKLCQFGTYLSYPNTTSPFCAAFSVANYQVVQYARDLFDYYRQGHAPSSYHQLFENLGCFLMQDLMRFIQSSAVNGQKARIFSSYVEVYHYMLVSLGAYRDIPINRSNFAQQTNRSFKSSQISPNGSNLVVIQFDCADGDNDILFMINERPLPIPGCEENGLCKQSLIVERFGHYLNADCHELYCTNE